MTKSKRLWGLISILLIAAVVGALDRKKSPVPGCRCFCGVFCIPRVLIAQGCVALTIVLWNVSLCFGVGGSSEHWSDLIVPLLQSLMTIVLGVQWKSNQERGRKPTLRSGDLWYWKCTQKRASTPSLENANESSEHLSKQDKFVSAMAEDGRKYELIYIVAEAICIVAVAVFLVFAEQRDEHVMKEAGISKVFMRLHFLVVPLCLVIRLNHYCSARPSSFLVSGVATGLDVFVFTWNAIAAGLIGHTAITSFVVNILLTYAVITFMPFLRSIVVVPICFSGYCLGAVLGSRLQWAELVLLGVGLGINLAAKKMIESSKYETFSLLEEKSQQALQEKLLRCQAEFQKDHALNGARHNRIHGCEVHPSGQNGKQPPGDGHISAQEEWHPPISLHSAPTVMLNSALHADLPEAVPQPNCLPTDAMVWLEGETLPKQLSEVEFGNRILCYDRLSGNLKHAAVCDMQELVGPVVWSTVTLADGTTLKLTADHPVQPVPTQAKELGMVGPWNMNTVVSAGDLRPGLDSLLVLKVVPIQVQSLELHEEVGKRVALSVQQPERHTIFVAPPGERTGCLQTMSVESSTMVSRPQVTLGARRTFLSFEQGDDMSVHAHSAPPSLYGSQSVPFSQKMNDEAQYAMHHEMVFHSTPESSLVPESLPSSLSLSSQKPSELSIGSSRDVIVHNGMSDVALSVVLSVNQAGWHSVGSSSHSTRECTPCAFENRRQFFGTKHCVKGSLCEYCHEPHETEIRKHKRHIKRKMRRENWLTDNPSLRSTAETAPVEDIEQG